MYIVYICDMYIWLYRIVYMVYNNECKVNNVNNNMCINMFRWCICIYDCVLQYMYIMYICDMYIWLYRTVYVYMVYNNDCTLYIYVYGEQ